MNDIILKQIWGALERVDCFIPRANGQQIQKITVRSPELAKFGYWGMKEKIIIEIEYGYDSREVSKEGAK